MNTGKFYRATVNPELYQLKYLEDGKHDATQRSVIGKLSHSENIKAPLIQVIQLLQKAYKYIFLKHETVWLILLKDIFVC